MRWPWKPKVVILTQPPLSEDELAGAFAVTPSTVWFRAVMQCIDDLERDAVTQGQHTVASHGVSASYLGGAQYLASLRDSIFALQQKGFGKLALDKNKA